MAIKIVCPNCQTTYNLAEEQAGKKVRCKQCEAVITVGPPKIQLGIPDQERPAPTVRKQDKINSINGSAPSSRRPDLVWRCPRTGGIVLRMKSRTCGRANRGRASGNPLVLAFS